MLERDQFPDRLEATLMAARSRSGLCIIDTPPAGGEWLAEAIRCADLVLIPVRLSPDDLKAMGSTLAAAK